MDVPLWLLFLYGLIENAIIFDTVIKICKIELTHQKIWTMALMMTVINITLRKLLPANLLLIMIIILFVQFILIYVFSRKASVKLAATIGAIFLLIALAETPVVFLAEKFLLGVNYNLAWIITGIPHLILIYLLPGLILSMEKFLKSNKRKRIPEAILLIIIFYLILTIGASAIYFLSFRGIYHFMGLNIPSKEAVSSIMVFGPCLTSILVITLAFYLLHHTDLEKELISEKIRNESAQDTIQLMNGHRHDFSNHLQVILGYLQINKPQDAESYIKSVNQELIDIKNDFLVPQPEIAVLLLAKRLECQDAGIRFSCDSYTDFKNLRIKAVDLVRILSNLIDNAIYELANNSLREDRAINVTFDNCADKFMMQVNNNGNIIDDISKIFSYGFTTKGKDGSGIGLYTVNKIVKKYRGNISVESNEAEGTTFAILV